ncbi:ethanolamine ammonia-lyase subunit EutB [Persicobacter diffluens]|uniref:Ethanolamine ammonia lyase large subunit n=1 Tax=Persicobacter diffluens TaxID=981 RepID=A0AAN5AJK8_9BACT|nr:ethanolamine ammonia lyase large subunit [Persicobacter diffluens]
MKLISRKQFLAQSKKFGLYFAFSSFGCLDAFGLKPPYKNIQPSPTEEDLFSYITQIAGQFDTDLFKKLLGAANEFKEGDDLLGISAENPQQRATARKLLSNTKIGSLVQHPIFEDDLYRLILKTTLYDEKYQDWTMGDLKAFILEEDEQAIKAVMPYLSSDVIACVVKLMSNQELIQTGSKIFNVLPNSKIGSKGYLGARVQPNSPTDNTEDIIWQVFNAWSFAVGDLLLGTNPVSSNPDSVAKIEAALLDVLKTFNLQGQMPNCVLSHIDIQAKVEEKHPGSTGIWFQSLAGTVEANQTFDVTIEKMIRYAKQRNGQYGLYIETGQGADFTNGHGEGFDMVIHEARKYGFLRALKTYMPQNDQHPPTSFLNNVAGFIGPEVFRTKEQLVRCCLEDITMGKLHGLTIGLDICSTLHMDIDLDDLNWCIDEIMPANPAYFMALPTKNDPMLSYLTTSFSDHVRVREKFNYKVDDTIWQFFKDLEIIGEDDLPTAHFGDPIWVYYQYCKHKNDHRSKEDIYAEGQAAIERIKARGVNIAEGYGENYWDLNPGLAAEVESLYQDAKVSIWTEMNADFVLSIPAALRVFTASTDRKDYVYHPESGEKITSQSLSALREMRTSWKGESPEIQIIISDGLNARAIMDDGHLFPYLEHLQNELAVNNYRLSKQPVIIKNGRVRAGYHCGQHIFGEAGKQQEKRGIIHIIGERPGSGHHNFSAYLTVSNKDLWAKGEIDHDITRVVSGISDTALQPKIAAAETVSIINQLFHQA